jgi:hypothetical protein
MYTFKDNDSTLHVYKHHDGYPTGAAQWLNNALAFAWSLPRYEADDFAAAFVAGNKIPHWSQETLIETLDKLAKSPRPKNYKDKIINVKFSVPNYAVGGGFGGPGGGVRLMPSGNVEDVAPGDIEYRYEITQGNDGALRVAAYTVNAWDTYQEEMILNCRLDEFADKAKAYEDAQKESESVDA